MFFLLGLSFSWGIRFSLPFHSLFPLPGDREADLDTVGGCPQGRAPVRDCLGALGQAFQLAGPDLSGGLSSREINRGGGLQ